MAIRWSRIVNVAIIGVGACQVDSAPHSPVGCQRNVAYLQDRLGPIVLAYAERHGTLPAGFDLALQESGETLPRRGDYYGGPLTYEQQPNGFRWVAFGPNRQYDGGNGDDLVVTYTDGVWRDNLTPGSLPCP